MLVQAIINKLNEYFPNYDVYCDEISQGFQEPCFFVQQLPNRRNKEIQSYQNTVDFDVQYFLDEDETDINEKYESMIYKLYQILEYISVEDKKIHGTQMNTSIVDGVLHFYVTYTFYLQVIEEKEKMKSLDVKESVKG